MSPETQKALNLFYELSVRNKSEDAKAIRRSIETNQLGFETRASKLEAERDFTATFNAREELINYCKGKYSIANELREEIKNVDEEIRLEREKFEKQDDYQYHKMLLEEYRERHDRYEDGGKQRIVLWSVICCVLLTIIYFHIYFNYLTEIYFFWKFYMFCFFLPLVIACVCIYLFISSRSGKSEYESYESAQKSLNKLNAEFKKSIEPLKKRQENYKTIINIVESRR